MDVVVIYACKQLFVDRLTGGPDAVHQETNHHPFLSLSKSDMTQEVFR